MESLRLVLLAGLFLIGLSAQAQQKYWVFFTDKDQSQSLILQNQLDKKTQERRLRNGAEAWNWDDLPVREAYLSAVGLLADSMGNSSRWFNACGAWLSEQAAAQVACLPFVKEVRLMRLQAVAAQIILSDTGRQDKLVYRQLALMQGQAFQQRGYRGKGVLIAVFDVGFNGVNEHRAFSHLMTRNQISSTWDFIRNREDVYKSGLHGTTVLSNIAGIEIHADGQDTTFLGLAPDAAFLLARTERTYTEGRYEEDNWVAATEWAEQKGADIISSSLGYTSQGYFKSQMNGSSIVALAANKAARKGVLVLVAAGNSGTDTWKFIATPGDADSALTVGGVEVLNQYHINFSSYGPTADGRLKPNVVAPGHAYVATANDRYSEADGTSFATPLVAGFAACVLQLKPELRSMDLLTEIEKSGHLHPYYDYAHGYGIPQAGYFLDSEKPASPPLFDFEEDASFISINLSDTFNILRNALLKSDLLYYNFSDQEGHLLRYTVVRIDKGSTTIQINKDRIPEGATLLQVWLNGYIQKYKLTTG